MIRQKYIYSVLAALLLAVVAFFFFFPDDVEGNVLQQADMMQGTANGQEGVAYHEATGETTRWTNSLFSGMPNFQISPSYPANEVLGGFQKVYSLWLPAPANLLFMMMVGFFIMCLCMRMKWYTSLFAAVAWGFSSYFVIIIGAGHIWKFMALAYVPPAIGGLALLYRGKYLAGTAMTALFGAMQLQSNHPQMSYYFFFVVLFLLMAWLWNAVRENRMKEWGIATGCAVIAAIFAIGTNSPSLYNSWEYSKETIRGRATELNVGNDNPTGGLSREYITGWSYGIGETTTLLIPNVKGGATVKPVGGSVQLKSIGETDKIQNSSLSQEQRMLVSQLPQYFGDQPMTNGPVYVGAFVLVLAILALFIVEGAVKWALFAVSVLAVMLAWGHNFNLMTDLFIDYVPGYNKFRTVSSILVIVEFTVPLLAALCIRKIIRTNNFMDKYGSIFYVVAGFCAFVCLLGWIAPSIFGNPFSQSELEQINQAGLMSQPAYAQALAAVSDARLSLVSSDSFRSFFFIVIGVVIVLLYVKGIFVNRAMFVCCLTLLAIVDLYPLNKRYVNSENFTTPTNNNTAFNMTEADKAILQDTAMNYRVLDLGGFAEARSSYFHKTIGGYHAAKLTRYNDLIDKQIMNANPNVINMLNAKYFLNGDQYEKNPDAYGNAWFVDGIKYVGTPDEEMRMLDTLNTRLYAVADNRFKDILGTTSVAEPGDTIFETTYAPNRLNFSYKTGQERIAVFSEVFFPWGWKATIDGKEYPIGRVNYVLRAMRLPAGHHAIEMVFDPESVRTTNTLSIIALCLIGLVCCAALGKWGYAVYRRDLRDEEDSDDQEVTMGDSKFQNEQTSANGSRSRKAESSDKGKGDGKAVSSSKKEKNRR